MRVAEAPGLRTRSSARRFWFALLFCMAVAGCRSSQRSADVLAKVNGKPILRSEVDTYYRSQTAESPQPPSSEQATTLRLNILKELVNQELMMQRAQKLGLLATDEEVESKVAEMKAPYTQEEFDKRLKERGITLDDFKRDLRRNLTITKVINKEVTSKITISDADISSYYNAHKAEFNLVEPQYHLAQIVVTTQPNPQIRTNKATNEPEARKKIQMVQNRLESGEDFNTIAMNYSEDQSTSGNGGDMGLVPESAFKSDPIASQVVLKLKPGQTSGIIPVIDPGSRQVVGFRIIKLVAKEPAGQRELNDPRVQQFIREQLRGSREQLLKAAYYEVVRDEAKVENYYAEDVLKNSGK